jgi:hypothetical protein
MAPRLFANHRSWLVTCDPSVWLQVEDSKDAIVSADPRLSPQPHFPPAAFPGGKPTIEQNTVRTQLLPARPSRHVLGAPNRATARSHHQSTSRLSLGNLIMPTQRAESSWYQKLTRLFHTRHPQRSVDLLCRTPTIHHASSRTGTPRITGRWRSRSSRPS